MKRFNVFFSVLAICLFLTGNCIAQTIKIGLMAPLTGSYASEGQDMQKVVSLLAEEVNKKGGINGTPVELIIEDDGSDPRTAANAANRLISKDVHFVVGTYGSAVTEATQDIYDEGGVLQIATGSTSIRLTTKGLPNFFRTSPRDDEQARVAVEKLIQMGFKTVAILHDNTAYAKGLADETKEILKKNDTLKIVFFDAIQPKERDYSTMLTKLKGINAEIIFFTGYYPEAGLLLRQMREMKWHIPMIGGDAANNADLVKIAGVDAAKGYLFISPAMPGDLDTSTAKDFLTAYKAKYNAVPSSIWSVAAGDAFNVIVAGITAAGNDVSKVSAYLHTGLKNFDGLTGTLSFDANGDRIGDIYRLYEVNDKGDFVFK